jgi:hypothetical protein
VAGAAGARELKARGFTSTRKSHMRGFRVEAADPASAKHRVVITSTQIRCI